MATVVPDPVLDTRDEDSLAAQAIGAMPGELSDRSDSNPATVIIEGCAWLIGFLLFQINNWPQAVIQKCLALVGVTLKAATAAVVTQKFTLSAPQQTDTVIGEGAQVSVEDGSIVFATLDDLTIAAYTAPTGTVTFSSGSTTVAGSGTTFQTGSTWEGWQIQPAGAAYWYTIASVASTTSLTISTAATATVSGTAWYVGPITGTVQAQATTTGSETNVGADTLTTNQSGAAGVASVTNPAAATGGAEAETTAEAIARAQTAFGARDVALTAEDYAYFAARTLGNGGRARARANMNVTTGTSGYVTVASLSPTWTASLAASASERAAVVRDLSTRTFTGSTTVDVAANIQSFTPIVAFYRKSSFDSATARVNVAAALNTYLSPNTYDWGRIVYPTDLVQVVESVAAVDRVHSVNGVSAVSMSSTTSAATATFTNGSATVSAVGGADYGDATAGMTWIKAPDGLAYLITAKSGGNEFTLDSVFAGATTTVTYVYFDAENKALTNWYSLPYSNLSVSTSAPASTVIAQGSE